MSTLPLPGQRVRTLVPVSGVSHPLPAGPGTVLSWGEATVLAAEWGALPLPVGSVFVALDGDPDTKPWAFDPAKVEPIDAETPPACQTCGNDYTPADGIGATNERCPTCEDGR